MQILLNPDDVTRISNPHICALVELRFRQLGTVDDADLIVVEVGDSVEALEAASGCPLLFDPFTDTRYGDEEFTPSADAIEEHDHAYTLLFVTSDDHAVEFFVPKAGGIDIHLLAMCKQYAIPAATVTPP